MELPLLGAGGLQLILPNELQWPNEFWLCSVDYLITKVVVDRSSLPATQGLHEGLCSRGWSSQLLRACKFKACVLLIPEESPHPSNLQGREKVGKKICSKGMLTQGMW